MFGSTNDNIDLQEILQRSAVFEAALRESEERFRVTFERAPIGVAHVSVDGRCLRVNQKLCEILGYSEEELRTLTLEEITYPADLPAHAEQFAKVCKGEIDAYSMEERQIRKHGPLVWVNLTIAVVRDSGQKPSYVIAIIEDIEARKRAEEALFLSEQRLQLAQRVARIGTFDWDIQTGRNRWTEELERIYGLEPGQFTGSEAAWEELIHPEDRKVTLDRIAQALKQGDFEGEWRVVWPDGSI